MTKTLKAWRVPLYGGPELLVPVTRPIPVPKPGEVLIRIHASGASRADTMMRAGTPRFARLFLGLRRPRNDLIGTGLSGEVIAVGKAVSEFQPGDLVYGEATEVPGSNATHICLPQDGVLRHKPATLSHDIAAVMCDGPLTSYNFLHHLAGIRPGDRVLILGASGSLGSAAVQIAAAAGANVTATCSARNTGMVTALGAGRVIDYTTTDFTRDDVRYDIIYDTQGTSSFARAKSVLADNGRYICPVLDLGLLGAMLKTLVTGGRKALFSATGLKKPKDLLPLLKRLETMIADQTLTPIIDRTYPLDQLAEAHRYVETGRKRGSVVIA